MKNRLQKKGSDRHRHFSYDGTQTCRKLPDQSALRFCWTVGKSTGPPPQVLQTCDVVLEGRSGRSEGVNFGHFYYSRNKRRRFCGGGPVAPAASFSSGPQTGPCSSAGTWPRTRWGSGVCAQSEQTDLRTESAGPHRPGGRGHAPLLGEHGQALQQDGHHGLVQVGPRGQGLQVHLLLGQLVGAGLVPVHRPLDAVAQPELCVGGFRHLWDRRGSGGHGGRGCGKATSLTAGGPSMDWSRSGCSAETEQLRQNVGQNRQLPAVEVPFGPGARTRSGLTEPNPLSHGSEELQPVRTVTKTNPVPGKFGQKHFFIHRNYYVDVAGSEPVPEPNAAGTDGS